MNTLEGVGYDFENDFLTVTKKLFFKIIKLKSIVKKGNEEKDDDTTNFI